MVEATTRLGIPAADARLLAIGHCATIGLPVAGLVARIGRPGWPAENLAAELRIARHFRKCGVSVISPADYVAPRPVVTAAGAVTFWPLLRPIAADLDWGWLGRTLRMLHGVPVRTDLPSLRDPVGRVEWRLSTYAGRADARSDVVAAFSEGCGRARDMLSRVRSTLGVGSVHGDPANVVVIREGPLLLDFDLAGTGPAEWDLVSIAIRKRRFGLAPEAWNEFRSAYGFTRERWAGFEPLLRVRELLDASFVLASIDAHPEAVAELEVRIRALLDPGDRSLWNSLALVASTRRRRHREIGP
ncbi:MAG: phosphotransferase [Candidatus Binatia bacterium]